MTQLEGDIIDDRRVPAVVRAHRQLSNGKYYLRIERRGCRAAIGIVSSNRHTAGAGVDWCRCLEPLAASILQRVAEQPERHHGEHDDNAGWHDHPPVLAEMGGPVAHHRTP